MDIHQLEVARRNDATRRLKCQLTRVTGMILRVEYEPCVEASHRQGIYESRRFHAGKSLGAIQQRSEEHTSELQSLRHLVCRLLLEKIIHTLRLSSLRDGLGLGEAHRAYEPPA